MIMTCWIATPKHIINTNIPICANFSSKLVTAAVEETIILATPIGVNLKFQTYKQIQILYWSYFHLQETFHQTT